MARAILFSSFIIIGAIAGCQGAVIEPKTHAIKVFNYQGALPPIKDDRTGEIIRNDANETETSGENTIDEDACWDLIVERSTVTFALQVRVLNELEKDLKSLPVEIRSNLDDSIEKLADKLKSNMKKALDALKSESPEDYFDSLFETSENIIQMSALTRSSKLDERVFLVLVKAVSRLGRNNSDLIQGFIDQCSINERSPRPRVLELFHRI